MHKIVEAVCQRPNIGFDPRNITDVLEEEKRTSAVHNTSEQQQQSFLMLTSQQKKGGHVGQW